jgi:para-aminobenzoate synthetase component I
VQPHHLTLDWIEPLDLVAAGLAGDDWALLLAGQGDHRHARWSYLCPAPVATVLASGPECRSLLSRLGTRLKAAGVAHHADGPPFQGGWAGLLSYGLGHAFEAFERPDPVAGQAGHPWPDVALGLYDTLAAFDRQTRQVHVLSAGLDEFGQNPDPALAGARAWALAGRLREAPAGPASPTLTPGTGSLPVATSLDHFSGKVERAVRYIHAGDMFQANLSLRRSGKLGDGDTPSALLGRLLGAHPAPFSALMHLPGPAGGRRALVSHAPERFLSLRVDGVLETSPIKGTRSRQHDPVADDAAAASLLASEKDRAENLMIVDLMRNDLARVCQPGTVLVPRLAGLEAFSTVHHLVSDVQGRLKPGLGAFDALAAAFPPGSITGAPKVRAMEIISELENEPRGPWCGSMIRVGWDGAMDSSVLIRTAACHQSEPAAPWQVEVRGGAGIVADSMPEAEIAEMLLKTRALAWAVTGREDG